MAAWVVVFRQARIRRSRTGSGDGMRTKMDPWRAVGSGASGDGSALVAHNIGLWSPGEISTTAHAVFSFPPFLTLCLKFAIVSWYYELRHPWHLRLFITKSTSFFNVQPQLQPLQACRDDCPNPAPTSKTLTPATTRWLLPTAKSLKESSGRRCRLLRRRSSASRCRPPSLSATRRSSA
jgi:hypothetical protein